MTSGEDSELKTIKETEYGLPLEDKEAMWDRLVDHLGSLDKITRSISSRLDWSLNITSAISNDDLEQEALLGLWEAWKDRETGDTKWKAYVKNLTRVNPGVDLEDPSIFGKYASNRAHWIALRHVKKLIGHKDSVKSSGTVQTEQFVDLEKDQEGNDYYLEERLSALADNINQDAPLGAREMENFSEIFEVPHINLSSREFQELLFETASEVLSSRPIRGKGAQDPDLTRKYEAAAFKALFIDIGNVERKHGDYSPENLREKMIRYVDEGVLPRVDDQEKQYNTFKRAAQRVPDILAAHQMLIKKTIHSKLKA